MTSDLKKEIIDLIKKLPEDSAIDDIIYHLYVKKQIETGIKELDQGKSISYEQVMENAKKRLKEWLK